MNKMLLTFFACVFVTVDGLEELRKEGRDAVQSHTRSIQPLGIPIGKSENITHEREKRMPDAKKLDDGSFGYAWNVGNGVSYMKIHVGKNTNQGSTDNFAAAQHEVVSSMRDGGHGFLPKLNEKTGDSEKLYNDFLKTSKRIAPHKHVNLYEKSITGNQKYHGTTKPKTEGIGKQEFNFKDINFGKPVFSKDQNKEIKDAHSMLHEFNSKLKEEYDKFNKGIQYSGRPTVDWPKWQVHDMQELNFAHHMLNENLKSLENSGKADFEGDKQGSAENEHKTDGLEYNKQNVLKENQQKFAIVGNLDGVYKSIEVPIQESIVGWNNEDFTKDKVSNFQGFDSGENTFKTVSGNGEEDKHEVITNPMNVDLEQKRGTGSVDETIFKYLGETNYKPVVEEGRTFQDSLFNGDQDKPWSTQNAVINHQTSVGDTEQKQGSFEEASKYFDIGEGSRTIDGDYVQKAVSGFSYTPQTAIGSHFQINLKSNGEGNMYPQIASGFTSGSFSGMNPAMNQQLVDEQVERIKQIQQKVLASHFPGAGIYDVLDGNEQLGSGHQKFSIQSHPIHYQQNTQNTGLWKKDEDYGESKQTNPRLTYGFQNNDKEIDSNYRRERPQTSTKNNDGTSSFSYSNVKLGHSLQGLKRNGPLGNIRPRPTLKQNQITGEQTSTNEDESASGTESRSVTKEDETVWRPQRYSFKTKNDHHFHKDSHAEFGKFKNDESLKENEDSDTRKGRETQSGFEHGSSVQVHGHKKTYGSDDHVKADSYEDEEHKIEDVKTNAENIYSQFYKQALRKEPDVRVITKAVPVHKELKIPVPQLVRHPILIPVPIKVLEPYPFKIPVPVTVEKTVEVPVEKVIHYPVEKPVPMKVVKEVRVPVPKPYPVKVPVYKIKYIHHNKKKPQHEEY